MIAYASRTLNKAKQNYDAHKLEFLALKWAITDRFHEYLYGSTFDTIYRQQSVDLYIIHREAGHVIYGSSVGGKTRAL